MTGDGFRFQAPKAWIVSHKDNSASAVNGPVDRVEVLRFTLEKAYRPALFPAASRELDGVIAGIAKQLSGRIAGRSTVRIGGRRARSYRIEYGPGKSQEIAFVLEDRTEYQLLCRRPSNQSDEICRQLFTSFALS